MNKQGAIYLTVSLMILVILVQCTTSSPVGLLDSEERGNDNICLFSSRQIMFILKYLIDRVIAHHNLIKKAPGWGKRAPGLYYF
jgi:hypothetical protein